MRPARDEKLGCESYRWVGVIPPRVRYYFQFTKIRWKKSAKSGWGVGRKGWKRGNWSVRWGQEKKCHRPRNQAVKR